MSAPLRTSGGRLGAKIRRGEPAGRGAGRRPDAFSWTRMRRLADQQLPTAVLRACRPRPGPPPAAEEPAAGAVMRVRRCRPTAEPRRPRRRRSTWVGTAAGAPAGPRATFVAPQPPPEPRARLVSSPPPPHTHTTTSVKGARVSTAAHDAVVPTRASMGGPQKAVRRTGEAACCPPSSSTMRRSCRSASMIVSCRRAL